MRISCNTHVRSGYVQSPKQSKILQRRRRYYYYYLESSNFQPLCKAHKQYLREWRAFKNNKRVLICLENHVLVYRCCSSGIGILLACCYCKLVSVCAQSLLSCRWHGTSRDSGVYLKKTVNRLESYSRHLDVGNIKPFWSRHICWSWSKSWKLDICSALVFGRIAWCNNYFE